MTLLGQRTNLTTADVEILVCPVCHGALRFDGRASDQQPPNGQQRLDDGALVCRQCAGVWLVADGVPYLVDAGSVKGLDSLLRPIYNAIAPWHDTGVNWVLPILQYPDPGASRERYIEHLELSRLKPHDDGGTVRILEVGIGAGGNLQPLRRYLPMDLDVEIWGLDLSPGMLLQCRWRVEWFFSWPRVRLVLGDAHHLPFADATFDRVFHVGGINGYRDIRRGLAEMARVARPGTPIVVVDEELDPDRQHSFHHRLAFNSITWFDPDPRAPRDLLPAEATDVEVTWVSRFYYCLTFKKTAAPEQPGFPMTLGDDESPPHQPQPPHLDLSTASSAKSSGGRTGAPKGGISMAVTDILTEQELKELRAQYNPLKAGEVLGGVLPGFYPPVTDYIKAIGSTLYPEWQGQPAGPLSPANRERCLLAVLGLRQENLNLAIHIYLALMYEISPGEIAHTLVLAGIYSGISSFAHAIGIEVVALSALKKLLADPNGAGVEQVYKALSAAFPR